jgi:hypothetical protein
LCGLPWQESRGDGSNAADLERKPTNLTQPALLAQGDGALFWKISEGRKPMPAYSRKLSEEQRWKLVNITSARWPRRTTKTKPTTHDETTHGRHRRTGAGRGRRASALAQGAAGDDKFVTKRSSRNSGRRTSS